ncbi:VanZ family protein [Halalkalibacter akibai]|uniref:VanZ-like domain-containing protein n=1 Tax=Halalkalibacter akibai (strain ATCC 43226 / DSM 21942 / CIP 109018 / JCM 9157 / 1139) TaxID=1236973 RepID=W4QM76_HALA3|nr:VanZ family protein [Halalkalibacter akibai]GAE33201.1 hypothetical protein JCM9157_190 [Halalkalibacter akibai JCM 9157]
MRRLVKLLFLYWLPVFFVAAMIFTASSQPYHQQDIRPYLSHVTDMEKLQYMYNQLKVEHVQHRLYLEENGFKRTLVLIVEKGKWFVGFIGLMLLILFGIGVRYSVAYIRKRGFKRFLRTISILTFVALIGILLMFSGIFFAFRIEEALLYVKDRLMGEGTMQLVRGIEFTYAGNLISVERLGLESFIEFFIRKAAHFSFFFALGFLTYRALLASSCKKRTSYVIALIFNLLYAISDEVHQAFTPSRSPLVEDVILDFSGGITGVTLALLLYCFIDIRKSKNKSQRRYKGRRNKSV